MLMMGDKKKIATIILGKMGHGPSKPEASEEKSEESTDDKEAQKHGLSSAMDKFIDAVHERNTNKAVEAWLECKECSEGLSSEDYEEKKEHKEEV